MTARRSFNVATKEAHAPAVAYPPIEYAFNDDPIRPGGEPRTRIVVFNHPGEGAFMVLAGSTDGADSVQALFGVLKQGMARADYMYIRQLIREDKLTPGDLTDMISDAMEDWSGFPTQPSSDSPPSPPSSGGKSTGRARPSASTSPSSPSVAS